MAFDRELEIEVSPDVHAPQRVRAVLEAEFADLGDALFAAQVIASELVTNAILHGEPPVRLEVFATATGLRLVVHDGRPDVGLATPASRGLRIVNVLAADWGMTQTADGKCFWAEIAAPCWPRGCDQPAATSLEHRRDHGERDNNEQPQQPTPTPVGARPFREQLHVHELGVVAHGFSTTFTAPSFLAWNIS